MKHKKKSSVGKTLLYLFLGLAGLGWYIHVFLQGKNIALFHSKGAIATDERNLMLFAIIMVLLIAVPTVGLLYFMAWRYRESNTKKTYHPIANRSKVYLFTIWALPTLFILMLAVVLIPVTHKLEPHKNVAANAKPLTIQVVAMRWKWLFIYPEQQIATVNFVEIPKDRPVEFMLTADDAPMSSFWVPNLSGQLYAMTGHVHNLNLIASEKGSYPGRSAEINGSGFEGMKFVVRVTDDKDFESWVHGVRSYPSLDQKTYDELVKPTENHEITLYSVNDDRLFLRTLAKYAGSHEHNKRIDDTKSDDNMKMDHSMTMEHEGSNR